MKKILTLILAFAAVHTHAQMVGTDVFLKGHYVEVGIGHLGYYGSDGAAPTGYHPHNWTSTNLGFVADPGMTGWDTSTATSTSHYMGDYFLPGSPFEGWIMQVDTMRCDAFNNGSLTTFTYSGGMPTCTGSNLSYTTSGSQVIGTWQGTVDSITVTQVTTLDTNDLFFTVNVTLTNTAVAPKNNLYYLRSLDPDNDETWPGGAFATTNIIEHQMPDTFNASVVSATGPSSPMSYMALGTADTASRAVIYNSWPLTVAQDLSALYGETYTPADYTQGVYDNGDIAIGIVFSIPHLATVDSAGDSVLRVTSTGMRHPANKASFSYFYAFSPAAVDSAKAHTTSSTGSVGTLGIQNVNNAPAIKAYPNPTKNNVNITGLNTTDQLTVHDMMGRVVIEPRPATRQGVNNLSLGNLPVGAYIISVSDANGNVKANLPVQKK